jgi:hypothetical protein
MLTKLWIILLLALVVCPITAPFQTYEAKSTLGSTLTGTDTKPAVEPLVTKTGRLALLTTRSSVPALFDRTIAFPPSLLFQKHQSRPFAEPLVLRI